MTKKRNTTGRGGTSGTLPSQHFGEGDIGARLSSSIKLCVQPTIDDGQQDTFSCSTRKGHKKEMDDIHIGMR
jgi:hypothetical protein